MNRSKLNVEKLIKKTQEYMEGMEAGKQQAIRQYDDILFHICNELKDIKELLEKKQKCHNCREEIKHPSDKPTDVHFCHKCKGEADDYIEKELLGGE